LRFKFLTCVLIVFLLFSVATVLWVPWQVQNLLNEELTKRGKLAAETLDKSSIGALVVQDQGALNQLAKGFIRSNEILFVLIVDKEGRSLADSGIEANNLPVIEAQLPEIQKTEVDSVQSSKWPSTGEPFLTIARPVFYEQLRIGTVVLGISGRRVPLSISQLRIQIGLLCLGILGVGIFLAIRLAGSLSLPLQQIAAGMNSQSSQQLERTAGRVKELNQLVESIQRSENLFKKSLDDLGRQKLELETALAKSQEENNSVVSRLSAVTKQAESLQKKLQTLEAQSDHLVRVLPLVQFATGIAPEMDTSMHQISGSAEKLRQDLERLQNLISLYERASPLVPEDMEVIRQYKDFINYSQIKQSMDELVATIQGGANWAEQLTDLLKQFSVTDLAKLK
jgi:methyl-accepting chemotaxis protein